MEPGGGGHGDGGGGLLVVSKPAVRSHLGSSGGGGSGGGRSPMAVVADFLAEQDLDSNSISFTGLLAGALSPKAPPAAAARPCALAEVSPTAGWIWSPSPAAGVASPQSGAGVSHRQLLAQVQLQAVPALLPPPGAQEQAANDIKQQGVGEDEQDEEEDADGEGVRPSSSLKRRPALSSTAASATAHDGYNWRKYGQKQVKGCDNPRSYYRCTHPECPAKKLVEATPQGQLTDVVYKGEHNHSKPQMTRRMAVTRIADSPQPLSPAAAAGAVPLHLPPRIMSGDSVVSTSDEEEEEEEGDEDGNEEPDGKRRKKEKPLPLVVATPSPSSRQPPVVVQTNSEVDVLDDGYRWRKYGQKVVKGNPNPRSYYRCTHAGCPVRKHVERAAEDPKTVVTSYEGKHNHDLPAGRGGGGGGGAAGSPAAGGLQLLLMDAAVAAAAAAAKTT